MPIIKAPTPQGTRLVYFAHVPKCGGSAVEGWLTRRFGRLGFLDSKHLSGREGLPWSRTSPQHIDLGSLARLFPEGFFDQSFAVVRHPTARLISGYRFQIEMEKTITGLLSFSEWLGALTSARAADPFLYDNHTRPMDEMVPKGAKIFHLEHGLDAIIPWFDALTGDTSGPRAILPYNEHKAKMGNAKTKITINESDLALIGKMYAADFARFGYEVHAPLPKTSAPQLDPAFLAERDAARRSLSSLLVRVRRSVRRGIGW